MPVPTAPAATRVLVVADTHLTEATLDRMPAEVWELADAADLVLHAGDVVDRAVLDAFGRIGAVHAVLGNNDHALTGELPDSIELEVGGLTVAMVHDSGPSAGRGRRMARRFPRADVVVFGHSHQPVVDRTDTDLLLVNPGSPTHRRRQPVHTVGVLEIAGGRLTASIVEVGPLAR